MNRLTPTVQYGDLVQLVSPTNKTYTFLLLPGGQLHTHRGVLDHEELVGKLWGSQVYSHIGSAFYLLPPAFGNLLQ